MNNYITIGEIIKHYRKQNGLSQETLADGICDRKYLSHIENDKAKDRYYKSEKSEGECDTVYYAENKEYHKGKSKVDKGRNIP